MEVNWEKTMAFAEGSRCSMRSISSRSASILVLLWKVPGPIRPKIPAFLLTDAATAAGTCKYMYKFDTLPDIHRKTGFEHQPVLPAAFMKGLRPSASTPEVGAQAVYRCEGIWHLQPS